jgi:hypothetical protein
MVLRGVVTEKSNLGVERLPLSMQVGFNKYITFCEVLPVRIDCEISSYHNL